MIILFDLDGTLIEPYMERPDKAYFPTTPLPGRVEKLRELRQQGHLLGIVTNQAGVAFGYVTEQDWRRRLADVDDLFFAGGPDFDCLVVFDHVDAPDERYRRPDQLRLRKPRGDGIRLVLERHPSQTMAGALFVGDRLEDFHAAANAGVEFAWAAEFFDYAGAGTRTGASVKST